MTPQLVALSAESGPALDDAARRLGEVLAEQPGLPMAQLVASLARRPLLPHRLTFVARSAGEAAAALLRVAGVRGVAGVEDTAPVFLYPGVGDHYPAMGAGLYRALPGFRAVVDRCAELAEAELGTDPRTVLDLTGEHPAVPADPSGRPDLRAMVRGPEGNGLLDEPRFAQVLVFAVEYALTQVLAEWGLRPAALVGYSIGEYTAACVAGVLQFADAVRLVARRALLIERTPPGAMLAVLLGPDELADHLAAVGAELGLAAVEGPRLCVASGPSDRVGELAHRLTAAGVATRRLPVRHAFHSPVLAGRREDLAAVVTGFDLRPPELPLLSNMDGGWLTADRATDPGYWAGHMCGTVRFADNLAAMWARLAPLHAPVVLEVGPGRTLGTFAHQHPERPADGVVLATLRGPAEPGRDLDHLLAGVGAAWAHGAPVDLGRVLVP